MQVYAGSSGHSGRRRGLFAFVVAALVAVLGFVAPSVAWAAEGDVAQIGDTTYATLEDALYAASASSEDSVTIEVLKSCEITASITIPAGKAYTLTADADADVTITDTGRYGIRPNGSLTMENMTFVTNGQIALNGTTTDGPFGREIVFENATLRMDGEMHQFNSDGYYCAAIFADAPATFVFDGCDVEIKNYPSTGSALRWNGKNDDRGYGVEMINGTTFTASNCYSGFVGTLDMLVDSSVLNVVDNRGNGSNGTYYTITNGSEVTFEGNGTWGISAYTIDMSGGSKLTATGNGYSGVWVRILNVDETCTLDVENNGYTGSFTGVAASTSGASNAGISLWGNGIYKSEIAEGASVTIQNNAGPGIATLQTVADLTIGSATITNNGSYSAVYGGGIYNIGKVSLGSDVVLHNNHASIAGDDIYNTGTLTFGEVGSGWALDGEPDCTDTIDGWYLDGIDEDSELDADKRWEAHAESYDDVYVELYAVGEEAVNETLALKAAHGIESAEATLGATKILEGADIADYAFTFGLLDEEGNVLQTATNDAGGSVSFDVLEFSEESTYKYKISEVNDGQDGIVYDETVYGVTVGVTWNGEGACFVAEVTVEGSDDDTVTFTNTYETEETVTPGDDETTDGTAAEEEASSSDILPQTGDPVNIAAVVAVAAIAAVVAAISLGVLLTRRRG